MAHSGELFDAIHKIAASTRLAISSAICSEDMSKQSSKHSKENE